MSETKKTPKPRSKKPEVLMGGSISTSNPDTAHSMSDVELMEHGAPEIKETAPRISMADMVENLIPKKKEAEASDESFNTDTVVFDDTRAHINKNIKVLKVIPKLTFRLGMERTAEQYNKVPGAINTWAPFLKGRQFQTGLEKLPEVRKRLELALGHDLGPTSEFWADLVYKIEDKQHGQIMNFDDPVRGPIEEAVYYAMLASPLIANGLHEYRSGKKPYAEWYIEDREGEADAEASAREIEIQANEYYKQASSKRKLEIAKVLGLKNIHRVSPAVVDNELWKWLKSSSQNAVTFIDLYTMDSAKRSVSALVKDSINVNVIRRNNARDYVYGSEVLGSTEEQVVNKLLLPVNQTLRLALQDRVNSKLF